MNHAEKLAWIDRLKGWLDEFRPLPAAAVAELKTLYIEALVVAQRASQEAAGALEALLDLVFDATEVSLIEML